MCYFYNNLFIYSDFKNMITCVEFDVTESKSHKKIYFLNRATLMVESINSAQWWTKRVYN